MIQANELRIGNLFQDEDNTFCYFAGAWQRADGWIIRDSGNNTYKPAQGYPIPLTPELLKACGFELVEGIVGQYYLKTDRFLFSFYEGKNDIMIQDMKPVNTLAQGIADLKIECLHQLQNIFYALTGTELTVNIEQIKV